MKTKLIYSLVLVLCVFAGALTASAQTAHVKGKITDKGQPMPNVQVIYKSENTGRTVKLKTDKNGDFFAIGVPDDVYTVTIMDATGKTLFTHDKVLVGESGDDSEANTLTLDITNGTVDIKTPKGATAGNAVGSGNAKNSESGNKQPAISKEEMEKLKAEHEKGVNMNAMIAKYNAAQQAKDWQGASDILKQMIAVEPN